MRVLFKGTVRGIVVQETCLEGHYVTMWTVVLADGRTVCEPMYEFVLVCESVLEEVQALPLSHWDDVA